MAERIAIVGIIIENKNRSQKVQAVLSEFSNIIVGRMGRPDVAKDVNVITLVVRGEQQQISALSGKIGNIEGVTGKVIYSKKEISNE